MHSEPIQPQSLMSAALYGKRVSGGSWFIPCLMHQVLDGSWWLQAGLVNRTALHPTVFWPVLYRPEHNIGHRGDRHTKPRNQARLWQESLDLDHIRPLRAI